MKKLTKSEWTFITIGLLLLAILFTDMSINHEIYGFGFQPSFLTKAQIDKEKEKWEVTYTKIGYKNLIVMERLLIGGRDSPFRAGFVWQYEDGRDLILKFYFPIHIEFDVVKAYKEIRKRHTKEDENENYDLPWQYEGSRISC